MGRPYESHLFRQKITCSHISETLYKLRKFLNKIKIQNLENSRALKNLENTLKSTKEEILFRKKDEKGNAGNLWDFPATYFRIQNVKNRKIQRHTHVLSGP